MAVENTLGLAVVSMAILAGGYLLVVGLWYLMVYRPAREERRAGAEPDATPESEPADKPEGRGPTAR